MTVRDKVARVTAAGAAVATFAVIAIGSPATAADIRSQTVTRPNGGNGTVPFRLTYGASIVEGDVTFSNRSVTISGYVKAVSATREADIFAYNGNVSCWLEQFPSAPVNTTRFFDFGGQCNVPGGFSSVTVWFPTN